MKSMCKMDQRKSAGSGRNGSVALFAVFLLALLAGCAEKGPILLNAGYSPTKTVVAVPKGSVVRVGPVRDSRGVSAALVGKKTVQGQTDDITVQLAVSDLLTKMLKEAFDARGFTVKSIMETEGTHPGGLNLMAVGDVKTLRLESSSGLFLTTLRTTLVLKIMVGDAAEKKIIKTIDIDNLVNRYYMFYSREKVEKALSKTLSSVLDQVFEDEVFRKTAR